MDVDIFTYLGFYTKVYDSKEKYDNDEYVDLLFMDRLPKNDINNRLPTHILFKMYKNVNFKSKTNITHYIQTQNIINKLCDDQIDYIIYIDNYGDHRKIFMNSMGKTIHIRKMLY